jgi:glucuronoarabinoxylan endo-1,4-beta-xylanase
VLNLRFHWSYGVAGVAVVFCVLLSGLWHLYSPTPPSVTIHWNTVHQTIDGFGASATGYVGKFTPERADQFFDKKTGLGLSLLRLNVIPDTADSDCGCVSNDAPYQCVAGKQSQILTGDLLVAQLAMARGVHIVASPWSPPGQMKSTGKFCGVGQMKADPSNYLEYAERLASFPALMKANGVSIEAMSVQNEPDVENEGYDTCGWTGQQLHDFIPFLAKALSDAGFKEIKIAAPEESEWTFDKLDAVMKDPAVAEKVGLVFGHGYRTAKPSGLPETGGRHVWQTEVSDFTKFDGSMADGLKWAQHIHEYMTIGTNAWMFWSLDCREKFYSKENNMCLTDRGGHFAKRAYVLGQYAKFVRPGWQRIGVANQGNLLVTAYKGPEQAFAIVVVNTGTRAVRNQTFVLNGVTSQQALAEPWITSSAASLERRSAVPLTANGTVLTYTIPAQSVVTFEGRAAD